MERNWKDLSMNLVVDDSPVKPEENYEAQAQKLAVSAASEIEDMRQTARGRRQQHLHEAERFRVMSEAHRHAAALWHAIAHGGDGDDEVNGSDDDNLLRR